MKLFLITTVLLGLCFAGIAIKIWGKKDGKFAGTCASQNPLLNNNNERCSLCGKIPKKDEECNSFNPQSN
ncbi:MAG: membrane or secreted protein [Flavobacteriaceae bacterium]|nr:membrane or secreted protein [Flavobacteriaceae bacterium]|tara:strand:+ start:1524 stop:1733 length:210 start_codon:yes stop_codon:yes gene_type:complete